MGFIQLPKEAKKDSCFKDALPHFKKGRWPVPTQRPLDHSVLDMALQAEGNRWRGSVCCIPCGGIATILDWTQIPGSPDNISLHLGGLDPKDCDDPFAASRSLNKFSSPALWKLLTMLGSGSISDIEVHRWSQICCLTPVWPGGKLQTPAAQDSSGGQPPSGKAQGLGLSLAV